MNRRTKLFTLLLSAVVSLGSLQAQQIETPSIKGESSFAVITDSKTYEMCREQISLYKQTIESEGTNKSPSTAPHPYLCQKAFPSAEAF